MKITLTIPHMDSTGGGIPPVAEAHRKGLSALGNDVSVATFDDCRQHLWEKMPGISQWGFHADYSRVLSSLEPEIIHVHGIWSYHSAASHFYARKHHIPLVISPHGMLQKWALEISAWKKKIIGALFENPTMRNAACFHALTDAEYATIRDYGLKNPVAIIPNGIDMPDAPRDLKPRAVRRLLYLGRIYPHKGIPSLIDAWAKTTSSPRDAAWQLVIAGWDQKGHYRQLLDQCKKLHLDFAEVPRCKCEDFPRHEIIFAGSRFGEQKEELFRNVDAFVLPSLGEAMPVSVLEAWSYRLPCLLTSACNLPEGFQSDAAIKIEPSAGEIASGLEKLFAMTDQARQTMGQNGRKLVESKFTWPVVAQKLDAVYQWCTGKGPQPSYVKTE